MAVETPIGFFDPYQLELEDVSAAIREPSAGAAGARRRHGQARTIEALYRSADSGLPVRL